MCLLEMFSDESTLIHRAWLPQWDCSSRLHPRTRWTLLVTCNPHSAIMGIKRKGRCKVVKNHHIASTTAASPARRVCSTDPARTIVSSIVPYRWVALARNLTCWYIVIRSLPTHFVRLRQKGNTCICKVTKSVCFVRKVYKYCRAHDPEK